jgi:hypothetical protein
VYELFVLASKKWAFVPVFCISNIFVIPAPEPVRLIQVPDPALPEIHRKTIGSGRSRAQRGRCPERRKLKKESPEYGG